MAASRRDIVVQRDARIEMRLFGEEKRARKTAGEVGLEFGEAVAADLLEFLGAAGEQPQFHLVARQSRPPGCRGSAPPEFFASRDFSASTPSRAHQRLGRFQLAPRRDHAAGIP